MIFFVSTEDNFNNNVLVETIDLNIGSEGTSFQIDNAQLSGLNIFGNSFNIKAKKIYPINKQLPIISSNDILGCKFFFNVFYCLYYTFSMTMRTIDNK